MNDRRAACSTLAGRVGAQLREATQCASTFLFVLSCTAANPELTGDCLPHNTLHHSASQAENRAAVSKNRDYFGKGGFGAEM